MSIEETMLGAWQLKNRNIEEGLIFHCFASLSIALGSDRCVKYASEKFVNVPDSYKKIIRKRN